MSQALQTQTAQQGLAALDPDIMEKLIVGGDLTALDAVQRLSYYKAVCDSVGLNPLTKPFDYLKLNNKLVLYARKDCTDQLRRINGVSISKIEQHLGTDGTYTVTAYASDKQGRSDVEDGVVWLKGLTGEALSNAKMKALTKAKRRVTLSICGLGWLDETEVDSIPGAQRVTEMDRDPAPKALQAPQTVLTPSGVDTTTGEIVVPEPPTALTDDSEGLAVDPEAAMNAERAALIQSIENLETNVFRFTQGQRTIRRQKALGCQDTDEASFDALAEYERVLSTAAETGAQR